ncbi:ATP6V1C1 [Bugula neritina]|uniref:V-type proton ATPase subunit C n=1 Tax=Bugula neritina TaxID=10212 RepID=A0A7J7J3U1_BUGNE|nr:ATP6V1C1 [Bugula neritina]
MTVEEIPTSNQGPLVRWLKVNFSESFTAWVHVKALRVFVESVLRYGLPVNFQAVLMQPHKKSSRKLHEILSAMYAHLDNAGAVSKQDMDIPGFQHLHADYYPYVFYKLDVAMG